VGRQCQTELTLDTVQCWWNESLKDGAIAGRKAVIEKLARNERDTDSGLQSIIDRYMQTELMWREEPVESKNDTQHCTWRNELPPKVVLVEFYSEWMKQAVNKGKGAALGNALFWKTMITMAPYTEKRPKVDGKFQPFVVKIGSLEECRDKFKVHTQNPDWVVESE